MSILKSNKCCQHLKNLFNLDNNLSSNFHIKHNPQELNENEFFAIKMFKGLRSKDLNRKIYKGIGLNNDEQQYVSILDSALAKMPDNNVSTYRVLSFHDKSEYEKFINQFNNEKIEFPSYTFASTDPDGLIKHSLNAPYQVKLRIDSKQGKYLGNYYQKDEVIFPRNSSFFVSKKEQHGNTFYSLLEDINPL